jgi:hypothetical protein
VSALSVFNLAALVLATFSASISGVCLIFSIEEDHRVAAWRWAALFVAASVVAAYYFYKLVEGKAA